MNTKGYLIICEIKLWQETDYGVTFYNGENNQRDEASKLKMHLFRWYYR